MPFARPSLGDLITRIANDIAGRIPGTGARLRRALTTVLGRVLAGATHGLYGHQEWIARQVIMDTCDDPVLTRWASIFRVPRKPANVSQGPIIVVGADQSVVPAQSLLQRADGWEYITQADVTVVNGSASCAVTSASPGEDANAVAGTVLTFVVPLNGISATATVDTAGLTGGADLEDPTAWRGRLLDRIQTPPQGGADADYEAWALSVPGVTRAWVYPMELGPGTVTVRFVRDNDADPIPTAAEATVVQDYIDSVRPVTSEVYVVAPIASPVDFTILLNPNSPETQAAVQAELADLFRRESEPGGTLLFSHMNEAVAIAVGEVDHVISQPSANVVSPTGLMATLGTITFGAL